MKLPIQTLYFWYQKALFHPQYRWLVILGTLVYFLSPFDLSPDFLPIAGQLDDFALLTLLFTGITQMISDALNPSTVEPLDNPEESGDTIDVDAVRIE
ncbi:MAG: YkvA family protein [Microcystaceae cyanobacterium]